MTPGPPSSSLRIGPFSTPPPSPRVRRAELGAVPGGWRRRLGRAAPPPAAPAASAKRPDQARRLLPALPRGRRTPPPSPCRRLASSLPPLAAFPFLRLAPSLPPHLSRSPRRPPSPRPAQSFPFALGLPLLGPTSSTPTTGADTLRGRPSASHRLPSSGRVQAAPPPPPHRRPLPAGGGSAAAAPPSCSRPGRTCRPGVRGARVWKPPPPQPPHPGRRRRLGRRWAGLYPPLPGCSDPKALGRSVP